MTAHEPFVESPDLRDRTGVFRDRAEAGERLADMLESRRRKGIILAVPAGGVPVGIRMAEKLGLPLDVAVVSKITLPWNTEVGCGAVAFDGSVALNRLLIAEVGLDEKDVRKGIEATRRKVERRVERLRGRLPFPALRGLSAVLVDDGLASGVTMKLAVEAVRKLGAAEVVVAVPTASLRTARDIAEIADALYCANVRSGWSFAVADAYLEWRDLGEGEVRGMLTSFFAGRRPGA